MDDDLQRTAGRAVLGGLLGSSFAPGELQLGVPVDALLDEWDELAVSSGALPWSRPGWMVPWWRCFGSAPAVVTLRSPGGALRAVLPLQQVRGALAAPTNWHTPEFSPVAADATARRAVLAAALACTDRRLTLGFVSPELAEHVVELAKGVGGLAHRRVLESSPYLHLVEGWQRGLDRHLLSELRRRERRLAERGRLELEVTDGRERLAALLAEGFEVEASGWKGRNGTAILSSPATRRFYESVGRWAADQGLLRLCFLRLDGRPLAFDLSVEHAGVHYLLKTGFDERESASGPGKLLRWRMLQDCASRGITDYELLGHAQAWKGDWTSSRRDRMQVHAFPSTGAGLRHWAVHARALPLARGVRRRVTAGLRGVAALRVPRP